MRVVLVTTDCVAVASAASPCWAPHPLTSVTVNAVTTAVDEATSPARRRMISTPPTVTSGLFGTGQAASRSIYDRL